MIAASGIERARIRWDIIGAEVALRRKGRELAGCCPFHAEKTPSFFVAPERGFFHCFGCGAHGTAIDFVMQTRGLDFPDAVREILGLPVQPGAAVVPKPGAEPARDTAADVDEVLAGCEPITDRTAAALYLLLRGLKTDQPALLAHPALYCHELRRPLPALVAPITSSEGRVTAVQRIWLLPSVEFDGTGQGPADNRAPLKARKKTLGIMGDGAVQLDPAIRPTLGLAEGVETALAVRRDYRMRCWATCGVARLGFPGHWPRRTPPGERPAIWVPPDRPPRDVDTVWCDERPPAIRIPDGVRDLVIFGDNGETGQLIARHAADWYTRHDMPARAEFPQPQFDDFNSQLIGRSR